MNEARHTAPLVLFALRREASHFLRDFEPQQRFRGAPCRAYFAGSPQRTVLVLETGVGPAASEVALRWALRKPLIGNVPYRPTLVLSAGYSGALCSALKVGDLVLATEAIDTDGRSWPTTWPEERSAAWQLPLTRGRVLTTPHLVTDPAEKRRLGDKHQALAVDMESAVAARVCKEQGMPYSCLRAVSDDWNTPLSPALADVAPDGRISWRRLLFALVRSPRLIGELLQLAKHTKAASRQLGVGLRDLLTLAQDQMK